MNFFSFILRGVRFIFYSTLFISALAGLGLCLLIFITAEDLPKLPEPLSRIMDIPQTEIYAVTGERLMTIGGRQPVTLGQISSHFIEAILATEDHRFWEHHGLNKLRTLKALFITLFESGKVQGASTITQQLAKNLFFSFEKSYVRKFKELLVAFQIEATSTKQEILHTYVNQIYFGAGAQGVEKASQVFFGKPAHDLILAEAALLAGLPKSPTRYNPFRHLDRALKRRDTVLQRMVAVGYITKEEARVAAEFQPSLNEKHDRTETGGYYLDALIHDLVEQYGEDVVFHGGIRVTATLDPRLQRAAQKAVKNGLVRLDNMLDLKGKEGPQGALVAVDTASGAVRAMVGGKDYRKTEFNRAVNGHRQPGSGFKPFLYYTAFDQLGLHGASVMTDEAVTIPVKGAKDWAPRNFEKSFKGPMILKNALTHSVNTIAAKLVALTGPQAVVETAALCGITSPLNPVYSVALGTSGVSPLEMATAFSTFASGGVRHRPFLIWRVEDSMGRVIQETVPRGERVLDPVLVYQIVDMMQAVVDRGSGRSVRRLGFSRPAAGKTGTTDHYNDAWFTGFTPGLCTSVWTGFDKERKLITPGGLGITGGRGSSPIWTEFMTEALKHEPVRDFPLPRALHFETVNSITGCSSEHFVQGEVEEVPLKATQELCQGEVP